MSDLTPEEKRIRALRAREVIDGAGWAFDAYAAKLHEGWELSNHDQAEHREIIWQRLKARKGLKDGLLSFINDYENDEVIRGARDNRDG